ncbi:MAG: hypothetical protein MZV64_34155 [Ignavibacteriales bacterium]|nr:hypothetical protein [Ignavibacteriales bacterium]
MASTSLKTRTSCSARTALVVARAELVVEIPGSGRIRPRASPVDSRASFSQFP